MNLKVTRRQAVALLVVSVVTLSVVGAGGTGVASAQEDLDVTVDVPQEATAEEPTNLSASISTPDLPRDHENDLTVTFYSDGQQIGLETITVSDGETTEVDLSHTFDSAGDKEIQVEASTTLGGEEFSGSDTTTLSVAEAEEQISIDGNLSLSIDTPDSPQVGEETTTTVESDIPSFTGAQEGELTLRLLVDGEETASKNVTVTGEETTETDFTTVFDSSGETTVSVEAVLTVGEQSVSESVSKTVDVEEAPPDTTSVEGAAFDVPESLEDDVEEYREGVPDELGIYVFVVATEDELYVVFTDKEPEKGYAEVEGFAREESINHSEFEFRVIAGTEVSFTQEGTPTTVPSVANKPEDYRLDLVRIEASHRSAAVRTVPPEIDLSYSSTTGILVEDPREPNEMFGEAGTFAQEIVIEPGMETIEDIVDDEQPHLFTSSFETAFWLDEEGTIDGIVLVPGSEAREFIDVFDPEGTQDVDAEEPLLYLVQEDYNPDEYDDIATLTQESEDGDVVQINTRLYQGTVSVKETIEEAAPECEGTDDLIYIQNVGCVFLPHDVLLHGGAAWTEVPQDRDDVLIVMGLSSWEQEIPIKNRTGRYDITGEVVSTEKIDESLPEGQILLVWNMEKTGEIDYEEVAEESQEIIEERAHELREELKEQIDVPNGDNIPQIVYMKAESIAAGESADLTPPEAEREQLGIERISLSAAEDIEEVHITASKFIELPTDVEAPPIEPVTLVDISASISNERIAEATIEFTVDPEEISGESELMIYRHYQGEWVELETTVVDETETEIVLEAKTSGFSFFAVGEVSEEPIVDDYTDKEGIVDTGGLRNAIADWRAGDIGTDLLRDVIAAWRSGDPVE